VTLDRSSSQDPIDEIGSMACVHLAEQRIVDELKCASLDPPQVRDELGAARLCNKAAYLSNPGVLSFAFEHRAAGRRVESFLKHHGWRLHLRNGTSHLFLRSLTLKKSSNSQHGRQHGSSQAVRLHAIYGSLHCLHWTVHIGNGAPYLPDAPASCLVLHILLCRRPLYEHQTPWF
jgi:hypothetical protein